MLSNRNLSVHEKVSGTEIATKLMLVGNNKASENDKENHRCFTESIGPLARNLAHFSEWQKNSISLPFLAPSFVVLSPSHFFVKLRHQQSDHAWQAIKNRQSTFNAPLTNRAGFALLSGLGSMLTQCMAWRQSGRKQQEGAKTVVFCHAQAKVSNSWTARERWKCIGEQRWEGQETPERMKMRLRDKKQRRRRMTMVCSHP